MNIQWGGKANKNVVKVEELILKFVIRLSHMIKHVYWLNSSYWVILNLHAIFVRLSSPLDIISNFVRHYVPFRGDLIHKCSMNIVVAVEIHLSDKVIRSSACVDQGFFGKGSGRVNFTIPY